MVKNTTGGNKAKRQKNNNDVDPVIIDRLEDQMYARVTKLLGGCNLVAYCNDNRERLCHIRGNMKKRSWLSVGDLILISLRGELGAGSSSKKEGAMERGDVVAKYDPRVIYKLRQKDPSINPHLFTNVETMDEKEKEKQLGSNPDDEGGFIFEGETNDILENTGVSIKKRYDVKPDISNDEEFNIDDI